jgi:hypothetical protein
LSCEYFRWLIRTTFFLYYSFRVFLWSLCVLQSSDLESRLTVKKLNEVHKLAKHCFQLFSTVSVYSLPIDTLH